MHLTRGAGCQSGGRSAGASLSFSPGSRPPGVITRATRLKINPAIGGGELSLVEWWCLRYRRTMDPVPTEKLRTTIAALEDRKSTRLNSSHVAISYAVF